MSQNSWIAVASATSVLCLLLAYLAFLRPRLRAERLAPLHHELAAVEARLGEGELQADQKPLQALLDDWRRTDESTGNATSRARMLPIPVPPLPSPGEPAEKTFDRLAALLDEPAVVLGAAGGEQLFRNLIESMGPESAAHLMDAARVLWDDGLVMAAFTAATGSPLGAVANYALNHGVHTALADHAVSLHALADLPAHVGHTLHDSAIHAGHAFDPTAAHGAHFPYIRMALSAIRETRLVLDERISVGHGIANVVIDTATTGLGVAAGAKGGAFLGTFFGGPVGAGIGAAIGAIVGGMVGAGTSMSIRHQPLKNAIETYQRTTNAADEQLRLSVEAAGRTAHVRASSAAEAYRRAIRPTPNLSDFCAADVDVVSAAGKLNAVVAEALRAEADGHERAARMTRQLIPPAGFFARLAGLDVAFEGQVDIERLAIRIRRWLERRLAALPTASTSPREALIKMATTPVPHGTGEAFRSTSRSLQSLRERYVNAVGAWLAKAAAAYHVAIADVADAIRAEAERHRGVLAACRMQQESAAAAVIAERHALGMD